MKTYDEILTDIKRRTREKLQEDYRPGSVIGMVNVALAETLEDVYREVEAAKNPYLYSKISGEELDDLGVMVNCPRENSESDKTYLYRLSHWLLRAEAGNDTAVQDALLNLKHSSHVTYIPQSHGCGTASFYVIPNDYSPPTVEAALLEAKSAVERVAPKEIYKEFLVPDQIGVVLTICLETDGGDIQLIQKNAERKIMRYINGIAPNAVMELGAINKMGMDEPNVRYFSVVALYLDNEVCGDHKVVQNLDTKFLLDEIIWIKEE